MPQKEGEHTPHVYKRAADVNLSWQLGGGLSLVGTDVFLNARGGYTHPFFHRLRLRGDASVHVNPANGNTYLTFDPELAFGITNHGLLTVGGRFGEKLTNGYHHLLQGYLTFKIVFPPLHGELDIGAATTNGWHPAFFLGWQMRW